jgi:hypothetical protein
MATKEIEREHLGTGKKYYVVYRERTYESGEEETQSCILLPAGHPIFGVSEDANGLQSHFCLPLLTTGHGTSLGNKQLGSWWLIFGDEARMEKDIERLPLADIKRLAIPQIVAALEEGETDSRRFSPRKRGIEADA